MSESKDDPLKDVSITIDDFRNCGWKEVIQGENGEDYFAMSGSFSASMREAIGNDKLSEAKVLRLFFEACSMPLSYSDNEQPFTRRPQNLVLENKGYLPEDFSSDDVKFFAMIIKEIDNLMLCARIADILWLHPESRNQKYALLAIKNYCKISITEDNWTMDVAAGFDRGIQLCLMLKKDAKDELSKIEVKLFKSIMDSSLEDRFLAFKIAELIWKYRLGYKTAEIAEKLEQLGNAFENANNTYDAGDYFEIAERFYEKLQNQDKHTELAIKVAENLVARGKFCQNSKVPDQAAASFWYKDAIAKYKSIDKVQREKYDADKRIKNLWEEIEKADKESLKQMVTIKSPEIDLSKFAAHARESVKGKNQIEALFSLICIMSDVSVEELREFAEEMIEKHPLLADAPVTRTFFDGSSKAKCDGFNPMSDNNEARIKVEMIRHYEMQLGMRARGVWFGFDAIKQEHRLTHTDFYEIVKRSPIIPRGREGLIAKGLFMGYNNDFVSAVHILIPQLENLVRYHLKLHGVQTTYMEDGIQTEKGLSALIKEEAVTTTFGADVAFEIEALFCHPFGPNLRNDLAHALLNDEQCQSEYFLYAWWFILKLVYKYFYLAWQRANEQANKDKEQE